MRIAILFTCYNRIEKTRNCIESIMRELDKEDSIQAEWYITDAGSSDGTTDLIKNKIESSCLHLKVLNNVYYSQGMRACMEMTLEHDECDYYILINDDVEFYEGFLGRLLSNVSDGQVIVGATDYAGKQTYGGVKYRKNPDRKNHFIPRSVQYDMVMIDSKDRDCHTFNANCVVIPKSIYQKVGVIDKKYVHGLGDFDYGMCIYEKMRTRGEDAGICSSDFYVGSCANNTKQGTWMDVSLSRRERIKRLNDVKGAPTKQWFYYLIKHFGFATAIVHSMSPYIRIVLGK